MGAAVGRPAMISPELEQGTLVPLIDRRNKVCTRCCLITTAAAQHKPEVQAFREWVLRGDPVPQTG